MSQMILMRLFYKLTNRRAIENIEILTRKIKMGNKEIDLIIKNGDEENNEGINKLITKVLGDLYVEKMIEKL